jgi:hypothetical protein
MRITYGHGFAVALPMRERVQTLQQELSKLPQYEPRTRHFFHGGMYCREVWRDAGVLVVGKVHKREHFYLIVSGTVAVTTDEGVEMITGPRVLLCKPGTKRAVYAETDALTMTFHRCDATTVEDAERELVEDDDTGMFGPGNLLKQHRIEVLP